ncbi:MAG: YgeY family selenium metabolism-linked hydrolase [Chloroflexota bacterium]
MPDPAACISRPALEALAQALVRLPSRSGQEAAIAQCVAAEMRRIGLEVRTDPMGNVIGRLGPGSGRKLLYDAHLDTVDIGDPSQWQRPPFGGVVEDGILYGRGACDTKGAIAAMLAAAQALVECGVALHGDLYLACVVQEEPCEGLAIRHVIEGEGIRPDWVVIGEPTNLHIARGQRGRMEIDIAVHGRASHASAPDRGVNAIYEAARLVVGIELLAPLLANDSFLGPGTIAVTEVRSTASSRNAVPDLCTLCVDRRLTVGETEARALAELRRVLAREGLQATLEVATTECVSYTGYRSQLRQVYPYWVTGADAWLTQQVAQTVEDMLGFVPHIGRWDFSTDGVYTAGVAGLPTIGFGPGEERYAHTVEEQVRLADLEAAARVYAALAARLLGRP